MALSKELKDRIVIAVTDKKLGEELIAAVEASEAAAVAALAADLEALDARVTALEGA